MRVLHVITDTDRRGAQVFATDLADAMGDLGVECRVVALAPGNVGGLQVQTLGPTRRSLRSLRELRRAMGKADVTVAHGSSTVLACALGGLGVGRPFVVRQISETRFWVNSPVRRLRVAGYLRLAARVIALAPGSARVLTEHLWLDESRIVVIPNGVPAAGFEHAGGAAESRAELRLPTEGRIAGYVGALVPEKGVDIAIDAIAHTPDAQLLIVGDGPERRRLEAVAEAAVPGRVHFVGSMSEVATAFAAIDLLLLPSRGGDSMPAVLIEAGLSGVPAVTTDVGAIAEVVEDGETGRVLSAGDVDSFRRVVSEVLHDSDALKSMGVAARERCLSTFEIGVVAAKWTDALRGLLVR